MPLKNPIMTENIKKEETNPMRNLKKFLALVLAMMMVFSLMVTVNAATVTVSDFQAEYDS